MGCTGHSGYTTVIVDVSEDGWKRLIPLWLGGIGGGGRGVRSREAAWSRAQLYGVENDWLLSGAILCHALLNYTYYLPLFLRCAIFIICYNKIASIGNMASGNRGWGSGGTYLVGLSAEEWLGARGLWQLVQQRRHWEAFARERAYQISHCLSLLVDASEDHKISVWGLATDFPKEAISRLGCSRTRLRGW